VLLLSCGGDDALPPVDVPTTGTPPMRLSEMNLFRWDGGAFTYNARVLAYELNTPLFSDYSLKDRALYVPEGQAMTFTEGGVFDMPVGTAIVKTFSFPADFRAPTEDVTLVETRVLIHTASGWQAWPYLWNEEQTDATLTPSGRVQELSFVDEAGETQTSSYLVPQRNQCQQCHERQTPDGEDTFITPIGPTARNLHRDFPYEAGTTNQLQAFADEGMLTGLPALESIGAARDFDEVRANVDTLSGEALDTAARDYLDVNCAHCHNPLGVQGETSQLFLNWDNTDEFRLGVCKRPGSAGAGTGGLTYDIVPGSPDDSILVFRVETTEVGAMMPLIGRSLQHETGARLVRRWVESMPVNTCE